MPATGKNKRLSLTENHDVVLRLGKRNPDPLRTLYIMLTFTDIKLLIASQLVPNANSHHIPTRTRYQLVPHTNSYQIPTRTNQLVLSQLVPNSC